MFESLSIDFANGATGYFYGIATWDDVQKFCKENGNVINVKVEYNEGGNT